MSNNPLPTAKLVQAIVDGDDAMLEQAIADGADVNADRSGNTPLLLAASHGNVHAFKALLDAGANANQPNHYGLTPAHELAKRGLTELIERLAQNPMVMLSRNNKAGNTPAHMAASSGHIACLQALINAQAAVDEPGKEDKTPLMLAIDRQDLEMTRVLLDNGARLDAADETGLSARERLAAWPAGASLASAAPSAPAPASNVAAAATEDALGDDEDAAPAAAADDFMGIGTISKRRPTP